MSTDLLPPDSLPPLPTSIDPIRPKKCTCEFCGCTLAPSGDVLAMSEQAREYRDLGDRLATARGELEKANADVERLTRELSEARSAATKPAPLVRL